MDTKNDVGETIFHLSAATVLLQALSQDVGRSNIVMRYEISNITRTVYSKMSCMQSGSEQR